MGFTDAVPAILDLPGAMTPASGIGTFEGVAAVYLAQFGEAKAVVRGVEALRDSGWLDPESLAHADPAAVADAWREAGAKGLARLIPALQRLARWAAGKSFDDPTPTEAFRDGLRALKGVGPATADAILLHGLGRAAYPVDRATYRVLVRHGWVDASADYDEARSVVEGALADDSAALARLSAGLEQVGKRWCRAGLPRCESCPLRPFLPEGGPLGAE
jgi:endonuclease-3 related protein